MTHTEIVKENVTVFIVRENLYFIDSLNGTHTTNISTTAKTNLSFIPDICYSNQITFWGLKGNITTKLNFIGKIPRISDFGI